ncbi:hypothetical protein Pelo_16286 [Pelomyxa schiedti]|nr:hypothetical protein Pelo_16286 [Pelomyxa schiedti]
MGNTVATPNKEADTEEEPYKHPKIVLTESQQERHDTMRDFYLSFVRHSPYDDSDRKLAVKLLRNVIKGGRVPSVLKSARATTGGKEEAASWDSPAHNFSALHMGATLGRAEEMDAILRTWAQRRTIVALPEWQAVSWLVDAVGKRHQLTALMEAAKGDQPAAVECLAGKWRANPLVFLEFSGGEGWGTALHICARLSRVACGEAILC